MSLAFTHTLRTALLAAPLFAAVAVTEAQATPSPMYNLPIYVTGTFLKGGTLSGEFILDSYGYPATPMSIVTTPGETDAGNNPISGYDYVSPANSEINLPDATTVTFFYYGINGTDYSVSLVLNFAHSLTTPGPDQITGGYECVAFTCTSTTERTIISGDANVPEPASLGLIGAGLIGLGVARRKAA